MGSANTLVEWVACWLTTKHLCRNMLKMSKASQWWETMRNPTPTQSTNSRGRGTKALILWPISNHRFWPRCVELTVACNGTGLLKLLMPQHLHAKNACEESQVGFHVSCPSAAAVPPPSPNERIQCNNYNNVKSCEHAAAGNGFWAVRWCKWMQMALQRNTSERAGLYITFVIHCYNVSRCLTYIYIYIV